MTEQQVASQYTSQDLQISLLSGMDVPLDGGPFTQVGGPFPNGQAALQWGEDLPIPFFILLYHNRCSFISREHLRKLWISWGKKTNHFILVFLSSELCRAHAERSGLLFKTIMPRSQQAI